MLLAERTHTGGAAMVDQGASIQTLALGKRSLFLPNLEEDQQCLWESLVFPNIVAVLLSAPLQPRLVQLKL